MGDFEVLAEEFVGEAEERLVLEGLVGAGRRGGEDVVYTRMRWESGFSLEVM